MSEIAAPAGLRARLDRILAAPTPQELWALQKELLAIEGEDAAAARRVVHAFFTCLRNFDSKAASRSASRWGAILGTAAVGGVAVQEMRARHEGSLRKLLDAGMPELLETGAPALLEVGSAVKSAQAWEVEARLVYDDVTWFLYEQLWELSGTAAPEVPAGDRRRQIDHLLDPVLDSAVSDADKTALVVRIFLTVLAARLYPVLEGAAG